MLILKLAIRNLIRHTRKSLTIGTLIMLGVAILFVANAIFESTDQGLQATFCAERDRRRGDERL